MLSKMFSHQKEAELPSFLQLPVTGNMLNGVACSLFGHQEETELFYK